MCRRAVVLAAVIGCVCAAPLTAQESEAELLRRIETLRSDVEEAARAAEDAAVRRASEAAAVRRELVTTFDVGPLRVMALHDRAETAAELFETVWREDFYGVTGSPSLERSVFVFDWWLTEPSGLHLVAEADFEGLVARRVDVARRWAPTRGAMRDHVRSVVWSALLDDFPQGSPMRAWLDNSAYTQPEDAYRSLATTGTAASRSCLSGDVVSCAVALGLGPVNPARLSEWFTPQRRQNLVRRATLSWYARADRESPDVVACLERNEMASCDAVLARIDDWEGVLPTTTPIPVSALWYAVRVGGEDAWRRAIEDPSDSPAAVLERVSGGVDSEAVIAGWRDFLLDRRPSVHAGLGRSVATALFWILIFAGFAMGSTRWRFA